MSEQKKQWPYLERGAEIREVRFLPAFHKCDPKPSKNYGIGGVRMLWFLHVDNAAVSWEVYTSWHLPKEAFVAARPDCDHPYHQGGPPVSEPDGGVVDFHSPVPMYTDHELRMHDCPVNGGDCYSDSGYILGSNLFDLLRTDGDEAVWARLRSMVDDMLLAAAAEAASLKQIEATDDDDASNDMTIDELRAALAPGSLEDYR